ncbi:MAG: toprim domain-containing protein [Prevotellaceae bacterium]|jgi:hypothetical protein|nr:toprim domain-containing protein [Prevotellaceae bacterium]
MEKPLEIATSSAPLGQAVEEQNSPANSATARKENLEAAMAMEAQAIEAKQGVMAKLVASAPVEISGREIAASEDLKEYRKNALEYAKKLRGEYINRDSGAVISLAKGGIQETLYHDGGNPAQIQSIAAIPQIIKNGIYVDTIDNEDREKHPFVESYDYYVAGLKIGDVDYTVKAVIAIDKDGQRYYDHALTEVEKRKLLDKAARITNPPLHQGGSSEDLPYKDKRLISILQAPISFADKKNIKVATGWERGADGEWHHHDFFSAPSFEQSRGKEDVNGKTLSYVRFERDAPLEMAVKLIEDFQNGKLQGFYTQETLKKTTTEVTTPEITTQTNNSMEAKEINIDLAKADFIKNLKKEDYNLRYTYNRMDEVQEIIRMNHLLPTKDMPLPIKVKDIDFILFKSKDNGVLADYMCVQNNEKFELYDMSMNTFNEYEKFMSAKLSDNNHSLNTEKKSENIEQSPAERIENEFTQRTMSRNIMMEAKEQKNQATTISEKEPKTYAEFARQFHEKDIASAISFIGKSGQGITTAESTRHLSFLEAHQNLLTEKETSVVMGKVDHGHLKEQYPYLHERASINADKRSPLNEIKAVVGQVKEQGGAWTFESALRVKAHEAALLKRGNLPSEFFPIRQEYNKNIAYQLNATADIKVFMEGSSYKQEHSTERWPRYKKGDTVLLVTDSNGFKNVKTGETGNLFKFIEAEYPKFSEKSATAHFVDVVLSQPTSEMRSKAHVQWMSERTQQPAAMTAGAPAVKKEFHLSDYRLEHLNTADNYLVHQRQVDKATLDSPIFKGSIIQGNKTHYISKVNGKEVEIPKHFNNVIYPFKTSPEAKNQEMTSLLLQYSKKFPVGDKMVDKLFAPGDGKNKAAWFSKLPAEGKVEHLFVMENPLDALSHYQLHKPENALYMATGGRPATAQLALFDEVAKKYGVEHKHLSFDNDMAGHSFDAQYLASKTPQYKIKQAPDSKNEEFIVQYKQLKPEQYAALRQAAKDKPSIVCKDDGSVSVHVKTQEELSRCNKYAAKFLAEDKTLRFTKSEKKDFNDDLKAFKMQSMVQNQNRDVQKTPGKVISR